jgi:hypothetical protein
MSREALLTPEFGLHDLNVPVPHLIEQRPVSFPVRKSASFPSFPEPHLKEREPGTFPRK